MPTDAMDVNAGALKPVLANTNEKSEIIAPIDEKTVVEGENVETHANGVEGSDEYQKDITDANIPTHEELHGPNALRRVSAPIPWAVYTVAFVELCERFSYYGTTIVFSNFINHHLPTGAAPGSHHNTGAGGGSSQGVSGALGKGPETANGIITFNNFWAYFAPLFGAWVADEHWGRYKTICVFLGISIFGHIVLVISSIPPVITNSSASLGVLILGIIIMGTGTGGFKPNISPLVVEQIPVTTLITLTLPSGEKVIVDPTITQSRIYHYFYLFVNIGALVGQIGMVYCEKYVGFWLAYLLPTLMFLICPAVMFWGRNRYNTKKPEGSVVTKAFKTLFLAQKGRWHLNPIRTWKSLHAADFWERVKPSHIEISKRPAWMTFDDMWVDEVHRGFAACAVFAWYPLYWVTYNQLNANFTAQAAIMQLHGVPNDVVNNLDPFALVILIPICDAFVYPTLRKFGIRFTPIRKIAAGFFMGSAAMIWATGVQHYIYKKSPCGYKAYSCLDADGNPLPAPINVWAQTGSYVLLAISEIFASITSLEYAFSKAPRNMRSLVQAVALSMSAISSAIGEALNPLSGDPLLVWNYGTMAVLSFFGGLCFMWQFRELDLQEDELNMLPEGHVIAQNKVDYKGDHLAPPTTVFKE